MLVVDDSRLLLICGKNGLGIRTKFSAFLPNGGAPKGPEDATPRKRGGQGVAAMNTAGVCDALSVDSRQRDPIANQKRVRPSVAK